jgi:hypothetical protein
MNKKSGVTKKSGTIGRAREAKQQVEYEERNNKLSKRSKVGQTRRAEQQVEQDKQQVK